MSSKSLVFTLFLSFCITSLLTAQNSPYSKTQILPDEHWTPANTGTNGLSSFNSGIVFIDNQNRFFFTGARPDRGVTFDILSDGEWSHFDSLKQGGIRKVLQDTSDNYWIQAYNTIMKYNSDLEYLGSIEFPVSDTLSDRISGFAIDSDQRIWVLHDFLSNAAVPDPQRLGGVTVHDPDSFDILSRSDTLNSIVTQYLNEGETEDIAFDKDGNAWVSARRPDYDVGGIFIFSPDLQVIEYYTEQNSEIPSFYISNLEKDANNNIWFTLPGNDELTGYFSENNWVTFNTENSPLTINCRDLHLGPDSKMYCNTSEKVYVYEDESWTTMPDSIAGFPFVNFYEIVSSPSGDMIFNPSSSPGVFVLSSGEWQYFSTLTDNGLFSKDIFGMSIDANDGLWISGFDGASYFDGKKATYYGIEDGLADKYIWKIHAATDGTVWFLAAQNGVSYLKDGEMHTYSDKGPFVESILEDTDGNIWMGSFNGNGILQYDGESFIHHEAVEGVIGDYVTSLAQGPDNNIYAGTDLGIAKYDEENWSLWTPDSTEEINSSEIAADKDQNIWMIGDSLMKWDGDVLSQYAYPEGHEITNVHHIEPDPNGNIWIGGYKIVYIFNIETETWAYHSLVQAAVIIKHDHSGNSWVGTYSGGLYKFNTLNALPIEESATSPTQFSLDQNYPNPFNPSTTIGFTLAESVNDLSITVYDLVGRKVATLLEKNAYSAGYHSINFEASGLASGMYLYRIESSKFTSSKKMMLIK